MLYLLLLIQSSLQINLLHIIILHNLACSLALFLIKEGNMGYNTFAIHILNGIYKSFCPLLIFAIINSAVFSADYCLFLDLLSLCLAPKISLSLIGVSKLVGYTIQIDISYYSVLND